MQQYDREYLFNNTNGCLAYFHHVYPQSVGFESKRKAFRVRSAQADPNPSTHLYKDDKGIYYIKDFGGTEKGMNAVDLCMQEEGFEKVREAFAFLYRFFSLSAPDLPALSAKWHREPTELPKDHSDIRALETPVRLAVFAPFLTPKQCLHYNFDELEYYEFVSYKKDENKNRTEALQLNRVFATEHFPIFCFNGPGFNKVYQPFADKQKGLRFNFLGKKPERYIYGWKQLFDEYDEIIADYDERIKIAEEGNEKKLLTTARDEFQFDEVFIASGGSDGLNLASLGKKAIWFNSESEQINPEEYNQLKKIVKVVYYVADLDKRGVEMAVELGMKFLEIKIIWLPMDYANTGKKDFRDWINNFKLAGVDSAINAFEGVKSQAKEFRWWYWDKSKNIKFNNVNTLYFLRHSGFYVYPLIHGQQQKGALTNIFIYIKNHVVKEVHYSEIKKHLLQWLEEKQISLKVQDKFISSLGVSEKQLLNLPTTQPNFSAATRSEQYFFFKNKPVRITPEGIELIAAKDVKNYVWDDKIINHRLTLDKTPQFTVTSDDAPGGTGIPDIVIHEHNNPFFNYIINASRVHWRKELEEPYGPDDTLAKEAYHKTNLFNIAGPVLSPEEVQEQKQHLINKLYGFGYILHSYKDQSKPWCLYIMDNKIPDASTQSKGGTGKSFGVKNIIKHFKNVFNIEGRNPRVLDNQFIYDGVDEDTDVIFVDDAHSSLNFGFFFTMLTGDMTVNPKHGKPFSLPYTVSPKLTITTNYVPAELDESIMRRLLILVYSDYYHQKSDDYRETRSIAAEFGKELFSDEFTDKDYSMFYNFCLQCLHFYLSCKNRVDAPEGNVRIRNLIQFMGDAFKEWAASYFGDDKLNTWIPRKTIQDDYKAFVGGSVMSVQKQKKALEKYCELQGWIFNPGKENYRDNIIKRELYIGDKRHIVEYYWIQTPGSNAPADTEAQATATPPQPEDQTLLDYNTEEY